MTRSQIRKVPDVVRWAALAALAVGSLYWTSDVLARCYKPSFTCLTFPIDPTSDCAPIPTSLPPAGDQGSGPFYIYDIAGGGQCGTETCWVFLRCPCGRDLLTTTCD